MVGLSLSFPYLQLIHDRAICVFQNPTEFKSLSGSLMVPAPPSALMGKRKSAEDK